MEQYVTLPTHGEEAGTAVSDEFRYPLESKAGTVPCVGGSFVALDRPLWVRPLAPFLVAARGG